MFVDDLFDKKSLTEAQGGGSPWHSEPEQQQMDADRRGRLERERNAGLDEPDDAASGSVQTGNGVYEYNVPAGQESTAQELGLQQHRGHWVSRVPIQRANFQFGQPQFHEIPSQGVAEGDAPIDHDWYRKQQERQTRAKQKQQGVAEGSEQRWRVTVGNKSGTLSHTKTFTGTKEQAIKQAVKRFATTRNPVVTAELVKQDMAEGLLGSDPNRGQKVPDWAKRGIVGKIGRKLDPAWSNIQMTVPPGLLSKQSSVSAADTPATKDMPKSTSVTPTRGIPQSTRTKPSQTVTKNVVKTIADKASVGEGMLDNPGDEDSPVAQAIIRRILLQRTDLLAKHGPEKVGQAVDEVADFVGDVDEIGSSDVSGWVRHVEQMLGNMEEDVAEGNMISKIKAPAAPSSPALAAPRAPAVAETLRQIDRMLESVNSKKSAEIVKAYADQQFAKLGLRNTTECKQIMAHVVHESAVRRRAYAQRMAK